MDEVYIFTVCEELGEGSGLQISDKECNFREPGELNFVFFYLH